MTLVNSKECVLLEEVGNFPSFRVFDFGPYTAIENSESSEIFTTLVNSKGMWLEKVGNFRTPHGNCFYKVTAVSIVLICSKILWELISTI